MPWWGHTLVVGLFLAGLAASAVTANALCALFGVLAGLLAEETIRDHRGNPPAIRALYGILAATLALAVLVLAVDGLGGDIILAVVIATAAASVALASWRVHRTSQLRRIHTEEAPR